MTTLADLLVVCCDAPALAQRAQADALLYSELTTRLSLTNKTYSFASFPPGGNGGPERANTYFFCGGTPPVGVAMLGGGSYQSPAATGAAGARQAALQQIDDVGAPLVAAVRAAMGNAFDAGRRQVRGQRVAVGGAFVLYPVMQLFADPTGANFSFPAGTYRVELAANIYADDPSNPATATFDLLSNGVHALTLSGQRVTINQANGGTLVPPSDALRYETTFVTMSGSLTLASSAALTLKNSGSVEQGCIGIIRVFPG